MSALLTRIPLPDAPAITSMAKRSRQLVPAADRCRRQSSHCDGPWLPEHMAAAGSAMMFAACDLSVDPVPSKHFAALGFC
jgi:hypothetical protein